MIDSERANQPTSERGAASPRSEVLDEIVSHRLEQADLRSILDKLSEAERAVFTEKLGDLFVRTSALEEIGRGLNANSSASDVLSRLTELFTKFMDARSATIFLSDPDTDELYTVATADDRMRAIRFARDQGIAGHIATTGEALIINDVDADPRFNADVDAETGRRTRSILGAPIRRAAGDAHHVIGVIEVVDKRSGDFEDSDLRLLEVLMTNAVPAIVNVQLRDELTRAREEEQKLFAVTSAISTELQLLPLLKKIMETVGELLEADRATLFMHDPRTSELWTAVSRDAAMQQIRFPDSKGIAGSVFTTGETINIPDAHEDPRFNPEFDRKTGYRTRSILCMGVTSRKGHRIAVTQVLNRTGGPFTRADERRLEAFSAQAAIAIENAQLFDEVVRIRNYNESILQSMSNAVVAIDRDGIIEKLNHAAARLLRIEGDEGHVGRPARDVFGHGNSWLVDTIENVLRTREPEVAVDATLVVPDAADASINLNAVPLNDAKDEPMGCLLLIEDLTREKRLKSTMARYMTKEVADRLLEEGEVALGGKTQRAAVLFSDIRSFTTISERLGAQETVRMLNDYFSIMVDIILGNSGILDKYIGDAIMAVFGVPFAGPRDSDNAVQAAIGMMRALAPFNAERVALGQDPVLIGLGINTDEVVSGNIGSIRRMDYTVIGDGVNLASRLEGANKPYGTQILVSEFTARDLQDSYRMREVDRIRVKGKEKPVAVHEVLDYVEQSRLPQIDDLLGRFNVAIESYRQRDWAKAGKGFDGALEVVPDDGVSRLYRERCKIFAAEPPAPDWDGVWVMKDK